MKQNSVWNVCILLMVAVIAAAVVSCKNTQSVQAVNEVPLGKTPPDGVSRKTLLVSPDSRHVVYALAGGGECRVVLDGVKGENHDEGLSVPLVFSPDGDRLAYSINRGDGEVPMIGGKEGSQYKTILGYTFSHDGKHVAMVTVKGDKRFLVVDDVEKEAPGVVPKHVYLSYDGRRVAYLTSTDGKVDIVVDGVVQTPQPSQSEQSITLIPDGRLAVGLCGANVFSPDGKHVGYVARIGEKEECAVLDGKAGKVYDAIEEHCLIFSDDGEHVAFCAMRGKKHLMVVDGVEGKEYGSIYDFAFSRDGRHHAYSVEEEGSRKIIVDGVEGPQYGWVGKDLIFITTENRLVETEFQLKFDDRFDMFFRGKITYSPDGNRLAYGAYDDGKWYVVVDKVKSSPWEDIGNPSFSPDSRHFAYVAFKEGKWRLVVDGVEKGPTYDVFPVNAQVVFDSNDSLHTIVAREGEFYRLEMKL